MNRSFFYFGISKVFPIAQYYAQYIFLHCGLYVKYALAPDNPTDNISLDKF